MSNDELGKKEGNGFLPNAPKVEDIIKNINTFFNDRGGWDDINAVAPKAEFSKPAEKVDLLKCFVHVYRDPAGGRVIDALLDYTLRRSMCIPTDIDRGVTPTLEQQTAYVLRRQGQNDVAAWLLAQIHEGLNMREPAADKKAGGKDD